MRDMVWIEGLREGLSKSGKPTAYIYVRSQDGEGKVLAFPFGGPGRHHFHEFIRGIFGNEMDGLLSAKDYGTVFEKIDKECLYEIEDYLENGYQRYLLKDVWRPVDRI